MKKSTLKAGVMLLAIGLGGLAVTANATVYTLNGGATITSQYYSTSVGSSFIAGASSFMDEYDFSIDGSRTYASNILSDFTANGSSGISSLSSALFSGFGAGATKLRDGVVTIFADNTGTRTTIKDTGLLGSGEYSIRISGTPKSEGGSYGGSVNISPIPEPKPYGMLLLGMGVLAFATRRKANKL